VLQDGDRVLAMSVPGARPKLLLVEDDRATYTALKGILTLRGWEVVVATTLAEAEAALAGHSDFNAAVLDLMLPDGGGEAVLKQLRERSSALPIAVTTGVSDGDRIAALLKLRPTVLLRKPIALADLLKAITVG
jgi:DNA-binding response OmpR family regulator